MPSLNPAQWTSLEAIIFEIRALATEAELRSYILTQLPGKLGSHFASWNGHNAEMRLVEIANSPDYEERVQALQELLNASLPSHPVFSHYVDFTTGKVQYVDTVERTREHASDGSFYDSAFYRNVALPLGIEDQLLLHVYIENGEGILITLHFPHIVTPEIQLLASILRSHIVVHYRSLLEQSSPQDKDLSAQLKSLLSSREFEVFEILCQGKSNSEVALALGVSTRTIDKHVENLFRKLKVSSRNVVISRYAAALR